MPLTALVLYCFGAISILSFCDSAVEILSYVIKIIIDVMYKVALRIESLPLSVIDINANLFTKVCAYSIAFIITATIINSTRRISLQGRGYE